MIAPDDPRHGTHRGYVLGCREDCCTRAHMRYMKLYRLGRTNRLIDPTGTVRRIRALYALGWSARQIGEHCGRSAEWSRHIEKQSRLVSTRTALLIADAYEHMCMTLPTGPCADRCRREAAAKGYAPPLAWDDIDDPKARPRRGAPRPRKTDVDPIVVERLLAGQRVESTKGERDEAMRLWLAWGRSEKSLCAIHGWHDSRYGRAS